MCTVFIGRVSGRSYCVLFLVAVFQAVFQAVLLYTVHRTYCTLLGLEKLTPKIEILTPKIEIPGIEKINLSILEDQSPGID